MVDSSELHRPGRAFEQIASSPTKFHLLLAAYFVLHCFIRLWVSPTADLDESEQLLATQKLAWGYGSQPPLYTWLLYPLIKWLGPSILPLTLLKNPLLFGIFSVTYHNARLLARSHWLAVLATVSLFFVPQLSWESQRDLTHTVLVTLFAALTFHCFIQLRRQPFLGWYLVTGICVALGVLSKYSFVIFLSGLTGAVLWDRDWRAALLNRRIWLAIVVAVLILSPHLSWMFLNKKTSLTAVDSFHLGASLPWLTAVGHGLKNMLIAVVPHSALLLLIYAVVCNYTTEPLPKSSAAGDSTTILRALGIMFGLVWVSIFLFRVTEFKGRWFTPLLLWLPILLVMKFQSRLTQPRVNCLLALAFVGALSVMVAVPSRVRLAGVLHRPRELNVSFEKLAAGMTNLETPKLIYAHNNWLGGNLKRCFPDAFVFSPFLFFQTNLPPGTNCLVVWDATDTNSPHLQIPERMFKSVNPEAGGLTPHYAEAPLWFVPNRQTRLGYAWVRGKSTVSSP